MCFLLIDDNLADGQVLQAQLRASLGTADIEVVSQPGNLSGFYDAVVLSHNAGTDVFGWLSAIRERQKLVPIVVLAAEPKWETAVALLKAGACDYLPKSESARMPQAIRTAIARAGTRLYTAEELQELRTSEERYRHISRLASDFAYIYRVSHTGTFRIEWVSEAFFKITGFSSIEEVRALGGWHAVIHPDDLERVYRERERVLAGEVVESEYRIVAKNGDDHWVHNTEEQIGGSTAEYRSRVAGISHEITEHKLAEESLREKEERLLMAFDSAQLFSWEWSPETDAIIAAPRFELWLGGRASTLESYLEVVFPDDRDAMRAAIHRAARSGTEYRQEFRYAAENGEILWFSTMARPFYDNQGVCIRLLGVTQDITEQKKTEAILSANEARLRLALKAAAMTNWEWRMADDAIFSGENHLNLMGAQPQTREAFQQLIHPDDRERIRETGDRAVAERREFQGEFRIIEANGNVRWYLSHGRPLLNAAGEVERMIGVTTDITDRKQDEVELREGRDRLQTLSRRLMDAQETERRRIARELHDETGQALTAVKLNLQSLKRHNGELPFGERLADTVQIIESLINSLRNISHELRPSILDDLGLSAALRWYVDRQAQRAGFTASFQGPDSDERLPAEIETACFRIVQEALTNVIRHAAARRVRVELQSHANEYRLVVNDDGIGFNVRSARALAEQGHSLGLLGMQERAQLAGGQFEIRSGKKGGTEITVRFARQATDALSTSGRKSRPLSSTFIATR